MIGMFSCEVFDVIFPLIDSLLDSVAKQRIALTKSFWISRKRCSIIGNDEFDYAKNFILYTVLLILGIIDIIQYTVLLILGIIDIIYSIIDTRNFWFYIQYYWYSELLILYTVLLSLLSFIYSRDRQPTRNFHTRSWAPKIKQQFINECFIFFLKKSYR